MSEPEKQPREPMTAAIPRAPHDERSASSHVALLGNDEEEPQICRGLD